MQPIKYLAMLVVAAAVGLPTWARADARQFDVRQDGGSRAEFVSDALLETINGVSSRLHGELHLDPNDLSKASGTLQIPVESIRTGIDLRDEHLQSAKWLDAKKHPDITFEITKVAGARKLEPGDTAKLTITGKLTLHGITRRVVARAQARYYPLTPELAETPGINGDVIRGKAQFKIKLSDYKIDVPTIVRLKVSNEIQVSIDLRAIASH